MFLKKYEFDIFKNAVFKIPYKNTFNFFFFFFEYIFFETSVLYLKR